MPVVIPADSALAKELARWNKPWKYVPFPRMVYRARKSPDGRMLCIDPRQTPEAEAFSTSNTKIVNDEDELQRAHAQGWVDDPKEAVERGHALERGISTAEAERFAAEARMSEKAQREAKARDEALSDGEHVGDLGEQPLDKSKAVLKCAATTKAGKRCSWKPVKGERYCKKHAR